jgi:hypothetical protein
MKRIKLLFIATLLFTGVANAQVSTSITDVLVNSQTTVNNCGLIDFGSISNNRLTVNFKLTKPSTQAIGNCTLRIFLKYSSYTSGSEKANVIVQSGSWANNTESIGNILCNISESEIQVAGSIIYIECTTDSGLKTRSCEYALKKTQTQTQTPKFTISPATVNIPCGSATPITFTVKNVNNSTGTLTYNWFFGYNHNWNYVTGSQVPSSITTTLNSIDLVSRTTINSDVSVVVTPILNGVSLPDLSSIITIAPFTRSMDIIGNNAICPSTLAVYGISNLGSGSTVSWSTSNTSIATVASNSGNQTTVNPIATQGTFVLTAVITNACGQQKTLTKTLGVGLPMFQINYTPRDLFVDLTLSPDYGSAALDEQGVNFNSISWNKISQEGGNVYFSSGRLNATILFPNQNSSITIDASMANECGRTTSYPLTLMSGYADSRIGNLEPSISIISNDLYEIINVPEDVNKIKVSVYDIYGRLVFKTNTTNQINLSNVKPGIYIINAQVKDKMITLKSIKK